MTIREELKQELKTKKLSVKWKVSSDIGPEWIGSKREVLFYLDSEPILDNSIHSFLEEILIDKLNIPTTSVDDNINGEGDLFILKNDLQIKYSISYTVPYDYPHKYDNGQVILISEI
jgi:hypothetical protein